MKKLLLSLICTLACAWIGNVTAQAQNLLTNPGFDLSTATLSLGLGGGLEISEAITDWQVYSVNASVTYTVQLDPGAVSPPNIIQYSKNNPADSAIRRDSHPAPVAPGNFYKTSVWMRDVDGTLNTANMMTFVFGPNDFSGTRNLLATANWQKLETVWKAPAASTNASFQLRVNEATGSLQYDSAVLEDVTTGDRMVNGGFENSATQLLDWNVINAGNNTVGTLVNDADEGNLALRLSQTATTGDGLLSKDGAGHLPWIGGHDMEVSFSVKDDPTLATGEYIDVQICEFDSADGFLGPCHNAPLKAAGSGSYARYTVTFTGINVSAAYMTVNFRIKNSGGAFMAGDVLLDNIVVRDLTAVPVTLSTFETN
jgi:hypothetical protein